MILSTINLVIVFNVIGAVVSENLEGCEENFVKVGCYKDRTRPLPDLLLNDRKHLKWNDWENFIKRLICRCARATRSSNFSYFGLQFFAECWSGVKPNVTYDHDGHSPPRGCVGPDLRKKACGDADPVCVGKGNRNYVYKLVTPPVTTVVTPTTGKDCKDQNPSCPRYASEGYCREYENIQIQCPRSCGTC